MKDGKKMAAKTRRLRPGTLIHQIEPGLVQVGSNPSHSVLFSGLSPEEFLWVRTLADSSPRGHASSVGGTELTDRQREALSLMDAVGLLALDEDPFSRLRVRVVGLNGVGVRLCHLLAERKVSHLEVKDGRPVDMESESFFPASTKGIGREQAMKEVIRSISPTTCTGKIAVPDLVIACSERTMDFGVLGMLLSHDTPHLSIIRDDRCVTVGPMVLPGRTACALCSELHDRDASLDLFRFTDALRAAGPCPETSFVSEMAAGAALSLLEAAVQNQISKVWLDCDADRAESPGFGSTPVLRVSSEGIRSNRIVPHPDCGCVGIPSLARAS